MRNKIFGWLEREFVSLSFEGVPGKSATEQLAGIFKRSAEVLSGIGLGLDQVVRTRLWARERESRDRASSERARTLVGSARSASSSFIAPDHFDSEALVALDLLIMRPARANAAKTLKEYEPAITPLRYLIYDSVVFLSGVTAVLPDLESQVADIVPRISESLADAGTSWEKAVKTSFFLHRSQKVDDMRRLFHARVSAAIPRLEYEFVDGYSSAGKLVEIEVTARL